MWKNSKEGTIKYLFSFIFIFFIIDPVHASSFQVADTTKVHIKDTSKLQGNDTSKVQGKDKLNLAGKDTASLQVKDTTKHVLPDSVLFIQKDFTGEELIRGERLFYGLAYPRDKAVSCSGCHNTRVSDTLNWNPDAIEISKIYILKSARDLSKVLLKPVGKKMAQVHKGFQFTTEEIVLMKAYMDTLPGIGLTAGKPVITNLLLLIIAFVFFLTSTLDLIIKKVFRKTWINWGVLSVTGTFIIYILAVNAIALGRSTGFAPEQPVKFSHAVHAGQNQIDCNYCHYSAKISKSSGIPPGSICLNCHFLVRTGTRSGVTEISKVLSAIDNKRAIKWVRIYNLPDFVYFSHAQHVTAGEVKCEECHGNVKEMDRLYQVPDLSMGWCIKCHDTKKVNLSNGYYRTYYPELYESWRAGKIDSVMVTGIGGRNCGKCHY
jgi:hypothetical protein